mmetsp:Transcript_21090/g.43970  ORF Transcript_21090/g.43970 Transcript_21090/m.43970 type:complete len:481 (-) Transcript_21090:149-1591(-)
MVSDAVAASLSHRDRSVVGTAQQREARVVLSSFFIDEPLVDERRRDDDRHRLLIMGSNATSLLDLLARKIYNGGMISGGDEIVIASENHLANVTPWLEVARVVGAKVRWWTLTDTAEQQKDRLPHCAAETKNDCGQLTESCILSDLINEKTKVVAISHASNIMGMERDIPSICNLVHSVTQNRGQVVVDGVAAAPHLLSPGSSIVGGPDWYVVSLHKLFGPHLGCLVGKRNRMIQLYCPEGTAACEDESALSDESLCKSWEMGTMNYEACCGAVGLMKYFDTLAIHARTKFVLGQGAVVDKGSGGCNQTSNQITSKTSNDHLGCDRAILSHMGGHINTSETCSHVSIARVFIQRVETRLLHRLLDYLYKSPLVRVMQDAEQMKVRHKSDAVPSSVANKNLQRIPIVCFVHANIPSREIVQHCRNYGVVCRACKFLSTERLWEELDIKDGGVVRFSFAHYNTLEEIESSIRVLEMMNGWSW